MKTTTADHKNHFLLCDSYFMPFSSWACLPAAFILKAKRLRSRLHKIVCVLLVGVQTILPAKVQVEGQAILSNCKSHILALVGAFSNTRAYTGIFLIAGAKLFSCFYLLFDQYYHWDTQFWNAYNFFYVLQSELFTVFLCTGAYLLFPVSNKLRYAMLIPMISAFARPFYLLSIPTDNLPIANAMVGQLPNWYWFLLGLPIGWFWFEAFEFLMTLHYHKREGTVDRIIGIIETPGVDDHSKIEIAHKEIVKLKSI